MEIKTHQRKRSGKDAAGRSSRVRKARCSRRVGARVGGVPNVAAPLTPPLRSRPYPRRSSAYSRRLRPIVCGRLARDLSAPTHRQGLCVAEMELAASRPPRVFFWAMSFASASEHWEDACSFGDWAWEATGKPPSPYDAHCTRISSHYPRATPSALYNAHCLQFYFKINSDASA